MLTIFSPQQSEMARFGIEHLHQAAREAGIQLAVGSLDEAPLLPGTGEIVARNLGERERHASRKAFGPGAEGYDLRKTPGGGFLLEAQGESGLMYAFMDLADTLLAGGEAAVAERSFQPSIGLRGVKFNLPFEPYETGDAFAKNVETCLSMDFWREYIDMLAQNRYNLLSLWSEHPFHMMFRLERYPEACPYTDTQLAQYQLLFHFIFRHAHARGIQVFLVTWNIRLPIQAALGLGLPAEMGNPYPLPVDAVGIGPVPRRAQLDEARQAQPVVQDYIKECIRTLLLTYPELDALGTNCAEEMVGTPQERQHWVEGAYLAGIRESGRKIPFIMRTNCGTCAIAEEFLQQCPAEENYVSWKYSYAHMYSSVKPAFEELEKIWEPIRHPEKLNVLFTVRNDDFHTLRWGDVDFVRAYLGHIAEKTYCRGFYWGCDGHLYASDFSHDPHGHKTWRYEFEKHWQEFSLLGRLAYDLETPESYWRAQYTRRYGECGAALYEAVKLASTIIPPVNRLHWMDIDIRWHPESLLSMFGFKTVLDTYYNPAMPGEATVSIRDFAKAELSGGAQGETPPQIIERLKAIAQGLEKALGTLAHAGLIGEGACLIEDLYCWQALALFYAARFTAALELARLAETGDETHREQAVAAAMEERAPWAALAQHWGSHYSSYLMARSKKQFGYGLYTKDVERDAELARGFGKIETEPSDFWVRNHITKA